MRLEFQKEALALAGDGRRLDHAPAEDDDFAAFGIELRRRAGSVSQAVRAPAKKRPRQQQAPARTRDSRHSATMPSSRKAPMASEQFGWLKRYEAGNQDTRGDGSQGPDQRVLHWKAIVAPGGYRGTSRGPDALIDLLQGAGSGRVRVEVCGQRRGRSSSLSMGIKLDRLGDSGTRLQRL